MDRVIFFSFLKRSGINRTICYTVSCIGRKQSPQWVLFIFALPFVENFNVPTKNCCLSYTNGQSVTVNVFLLINGERRANCFTAESQKKLILSCGAVQSLQPQRNVYYIYNLKQNLPVFAPLQSFSCRQDNLQWSITSACYCASHLNKYYIVFCL